MFQGKWYDEVGVGERFGTSVTVTETHLVLGSGMFGDFNPLHVDEEFAKKSTFGTRILHGPFTSALVPAPVGMYFARTAIAYLEHHCRFKAPVRPGDRHRRHDRRGEESERRSGARGRRQDPGRRQARSETRIYTVRDLIQRRSMWFFNHHTQRPSALQSPRCAIA
jgi:acyl dehydratase